MYACRHWFNLSVVLLMAAAMFASLPPDRIFLTADGGPTRLSMSNPNASLVIPKGDVDAGKISYRAMDLDVSCLRIDENENKMTLVSGIGGCKMNIKWSKDSENDHKKLSLKTGGSPGITEDYGGSSSVSVDVLDNGTAKLKNGANFPNCFVISKSNNNTVQGGKVVDFSVENIKQTCPDMAIEFDERYKLYEPPRSVSSGTPEDKNDNTVLIVCLSLAGALILLAAIGFGLWCLWKNRRDSAMPAAPTDVKVVPTQLTKPKDSPDMPKVTAISDTHVKTTQPKPTPEVKPSKAIVKEVPKLEPCPTEETETPLSKVIVSSKKKEKAQPKVVNSSKKQKIRSKKRTANEVRETVEKFGPLPPMHKKCKKGKSAVFADLFKIEDYKTPAIACKTKESAQRNKCVEETSVEEQKPAPPSTKRVPHFQKDYDDYVCSLEANKSVHKPEPEKQLPPSAKRQPRLREVMDPYVSSLENQ